MASPPPSPGRAPGAAGLITRQAIEERFGLAADKQDKGTAENDKDAPPAGPSGAGDDVIDAEVVDADDRARK